MDKNAACFSKNNSPFIGPIENHRQREKGVLVYPAYSRRSGGLSVGVNLFPGKKRCNFDCPYCEVFPFSSEAVFSLEQMEEDLREVISTALERSMPVRDICFSGNGEPTMAADFPEALERAGKVRANLVPGANLVLITNGSGLLDSGIFSLLRDAVFSLDLDIWLKLDAGTPDWYAKMSRSSLSYERIIERVKEFAACAPFTIQTMLCAIDAEGPPPDEVCGWEKLILELAAITGKFAVKSGAGIREPAPRSGRIEVPLRKIQIYGKARPAPEDPKAAELPVNYLEERAASIRTALAATGITPNVEVYP